MRLKIRARIMTQRGEGNHGRGSTMEFHSQEGWKAGMPVSVPYLPFPLEPADGSPGHSLVLRKLKKTLSMSRFIACSSTEQQAIAQAQLMNGTCIQIPNYCKERLVDSLAFVFLRACFNFYKCNYFQKIALDHVNSLPERCLSKVFFCLLN